MCSYNGCTQERSGKVENLIYILFICITIPLALMACLIDKKPRRIVIFFIVGICSAVFAAEVNGMLGYLIPLDMFEDRKSVV